MFGTRTFFSYFDFFLFAGEDSRKNIGMTMWRARGAGGETRRALAHATEASRAHNTSPRVGERNPQVRACAPSAGKYREPDPLKHRARPAEQRATMLQVPVFFLVSEILHVSRELM